MKEHELRLKTLLTGQQFVDDAQKDESLENAKEYAYAYAQATNGIAVISDLQQDVCYIYSGKFGHALGLPDYTENSSSAFESEIFLPMNCLSDIFLNLGSIISFSRYPLRRGPITMPSA